MVNTTSKEKPLLPMFDEVYSIDSNATSENVATKPSLRRSLTDTPAFKKWFGSSQVVDNEGRALVVYHGTASDFDSFDLTSHRSLLNEQYQGDGFHFSESADVASKYADASRNQFFNKQRIFDAADRVLSQQLASIFKEVVNDGYNKAWDKPIEEIRKIMDAENASGIDINDLLDLTEYVEGSNCHKGNDKSWDGGGALDLFGGTRAYMPDWVRDSAVKFGLDSALPNQNVMPVYLKAEKVLRTSDPNKAKQAKDNGYDAIYYTGTGTIDGQPEWIVFHPQQIKSAIGNYGDFDLQNPSILHSRVMSNQPRNATDFNQSRTAVVEAKAKFDQFRKLKEARSAAVKAQKVFDEVDAQALAGKEVDGDNYFSLSGALFDAKKHFAEELTTIPDDAFALQATTSDGRMLLLNGSAQRPGHWQLTRFDRAGEPWGDTQHPTKTQAIKDFLDEADVATVKDFDQVLRKTNNGNSSGTTATNIQSAIAPIIAAWNNAPKGGIHVVQSIDALPASVRAQLSTAAMHDTSGLFIPQTQAVYLIADHITDEAHAQFVLGHEILGHYGMRAVLPEVELRNQLRMLRKANPRLAALAQKQTTTFGYGLNLATEEALADMAGMNEQISGLGQIVAKLQQGLRKIKFDKLADWMEAHTEAETMNFLRRARDAVRGIKVHAFGTKESMAMFSRQDGPVPTFYSALRRTIQQLSRIASKDGTNKPDQALTWLAARQKEGKFKQEELEWSGLKDWLATATKKVAVTDIDAFLQDNGVKVHEIVKGGPDENAQLGFDITPSMRSVAINEGSPLFSRIAPAVQAFKRWFDGSQVVDTDGNPLVVYHGTGSDITEFDASRSGENFGGDDSGIYFTNNAWDKYAIDSSASAYAKNSAPDGGANVIPVYLSMKNPLIIYENMEGGPVRYADEQRNDIRRQVLEGRHDGVILRDTGSELESLDDKPEELYIVFRAEQIKSAISNNGQFNADNPNIMFSRKPCESKPSLDHDQVLQMTDFCATTGTNNANTDAITEHIPDSDEKKRQLLKLTYTALAVNIDDELFSLYGAATDRSPNYADVFDWVGNSRMNQVANKGILKVALRRGLISDDQFNSLLEEPAFEHGLEGNIHTSVPGLQRDQNSHHHDSIAADLQP